MKTRILTVFAALCFVFTANAQEELTIRLDLTSTPENPITNRMTYKGANVKVKYLKNVKGTILNNFEDNTWDYKVDENLTVPFSIYGPWLDNQRARCQFSIGDDKGFYVKYSSEDYPQRPQFMSIPGIPGYKLDKVTCTTWTYRRRFYLVVSNQIEGKPMSYDLLGNYKSYGEACEEEPHTFTFENLSTDGANVSEAGQTYYLANWTNGSVMYIDLTYVKE